MEGEVILMFILRSLGFLLISVSFFTGCDKIPGTQSAVVFIFENAKGIETGAPVLYKGTSVGRVTDVQIGDTGSIQIKAQIMGDFRQQLREPCTAFIEKTDSGQGEPTQAVVVYLGDRALEEGPALSRIEGCDSRPELLFWQAANMARSFAKEHESELESIKQAARDAAESTRNAMEQVKEFSESEDMKRFREKLNEFAEQTGERAKETYSELKQQWPELDAKLDEVYERLEELGKSEEAQRLRESIRDFFTPNPTATADEENS